MRWMSIVLASVMLMAVAAYAEDKKVIDASDTETLQKMVSKEVTVEGKVLSARWTQSGNIMFVNFSKDRDGKFVSIVKKENRDTLDKAFDGDIAKALDGKKIQVTGTVTSFKDTPQIEITKASQVKILKEEEKK